MARQSDLTVTERPEIHLVGQSIFTTLREVLEEKAGQRLKEAVFARVSEIQNRVGTDTFLIEIYPEGNFTFETPFTTFIGVQVSDIDQVPEGLASHTLPASRYAKVTHYGPESELTQTYEAVFNSLLQQAGLAYKRYHFEQWDHRYQPESAACEIDIYLAVR